MSRKVFYWLNVRIRSKGSSFHIIVIWLFYRPIRSLDSFHSYFLHRFRFFQQLKSTHGLLFDLFSITFIAQKRPNSQNFRRFDIGHTQIFGYHDSLLVRLIGSIIKAIKKLELPSEPLPLPVTLLKHLSMIRLPYCALADQRGHFSRLHVCPLDNSFLTFD